MERMERHNSEEVQSVKEDGPTNWESNISEIEAARHVSKDSDTNWQENMDQVAKLNEDTRTEARKIAEAEAVSNDAQTQWIDNKEEAQQYAAEQKNEPRSRSKTELSATVDQIREQEATVEYAEKMDQWGADLIKWAVGENYYDMGPDVNKVWADSVDIQQLMKSLGETQEGMQVMTAAMIARKKKAAE